MAANIKKIITTNEEIYFDGFKALDKPITRVTVSAVIDNPCAGKYVG